MDRDGRGALNDERRNRVFGQNFFGMVKLINLFTVAKNGGENGFTTTYPLSIDLKFSLKPEIGCKFMMKRRR